MMILTDKHKILLQLFLAKGLGDVTLNYIVTNFLLVKDDVAQCYAWSESDWQERLHLRPAQAQACVNALQDDTSWQQEIDLLFKFNAKIVTLLDDCYPASLRNIHTPPPVLFVQGFFAWQQRSVAIVGARQCSRYAKDIVDLLVPDLCSSGLAVISGGAVGVDTLAHHAALAFGGKTVAVLGSGLSRPYPYDNKALFERIALSGGAVVSCFPMTSSPEKHNFPIRNRLIAGLSSGVLVVQAREKSGALITAQYALDEGREVFAVPGLITDSLSQGCHNLLKNGAKLITCADDVLVELGVSSCSVVEKNVACPKVMPEKDKLLAFLSQAQSIEQLAVVSQLSPDEIAERLFALELSGHVQQSFSGLWSVV